MVNNRTQSIGATRSGTWIHTFHIDTGFITRTFRMYDTFRSAIRWLTNIILQTGTRGRTTDISALGETTTRGWHARVFLY